MKKIIAMMIAVFMLLSFCLAGSAEGDKVKCYSFGVMSGGPAWGQYQKGFYAARNSAGKASTSARRLTTTCPSCSTCMTPRSATARTS